MPNVKILWHDVRMMVLPYEVDSPFCNTSAKMSVRQSKSPEEREIGRRFAPLCGKFWPQSYKNFSLTGMPKVISMSLPLMYEHRSSAFTVAETGLENQCSNLHHQDTTNCSISLLLMCVNLTFLMLCCDKLSVRASTPAQNRAAKV